MKRLARVTAAMAALVAASAAIAQVPAGPMGTRATDTPRYLASATASERAIAICSGLWSGNQTLAQLDNHILSAPGELKTEVDQAKRTVSVTYAADMPPRIAVWRNILGCAQLPAGATMDAAKYLPQVSANLRAPNFDDQPWPMGDRDATAELPPTQKEALDKLMEAAFDGKSYGGKTWGIVVVKGGRIVAERYDLGFDIYVGHQTHSAAKSFAATLVGIATKKNGLDIKRPGALKEWRRPGDPRAQITVEHLLRMSSGLYAEGGGSPQANIYYHGGTVAELAATNILHTLPGTRFLYNPPDTMLLVRAVRQAVDNEARFLSYPYQELYWKIGMTRTITTSDWNGDFLMSGQTYSTARDFARFGLFYLADGVWKGERILPEGWAKYVATPGPVQPAPGLPGYGAQFWLYGGREGLPADTYGPSGGLGQYAMIIPSQDMVVVRRGVDARAGFQIEKFTADVVAALAPRSVQAATCDRTCLTQFVEQYLTALQARDASKLPVSANVKFTENTVELKLGEGLWKTITGVEPYRLIAADPVSGQAAYFGVIKENGKVNVMGLRLKVVDGRISEIETGLSRNNPFLEPANLRTPRKGLLESVPQAERSSREQMIAIADGYFDGIEKRSDKGVAFADECTRVENGVLTAASRIPPGMKPRLDGEVISCAMQFRLGATYTDVIAPRRYEVIDEERGLVMGVFAFNLSGTTNSTRQSDGTTREAAEWARFPSTGPLMEIFKIKNGKIHEIEAVMMPMLPYKSSTGWR